MLLTSWLASAKRNFRSSLRNRRRGTRQGGQDSIRSAAAASEVLEQRALLTALVINSNTLASLQTADGRIDITNATLGSHDSIVVESVALTPTSGDAISINLSGVTLDRIAIESVDVQSFGDVGIDINLTNVTGLNTLAIEDVSVAGPGVGVDITLNNSDIRGLTIDDSSLTAVRMDVLAGSDIEFGLITDNTIDAPAGLEGLQMNLDGGTADDFRILNNSGITTQDRDSVQINAVNTPVDGFTIAGNTIGAAEGAGVLFRAEGDTFVQPFVVTNNATQGERITQFVFDISPIGLEFDEGVNGQPFTAVGGTDTLTGLQSAVVDAGLQTLTVTFNDFDPGESLQFVIDIDIAGGVAASIFGDDLIGAAVDVDFTGGKAVSGTMAGDPDAVTASQFVTGAGAAGNSHGIHLNLDNSPFTDLAITDNTVQGTPGHAVFVNGINSSDLTGVVTGNSLLSAGRDGLRLELIDSNFTGAVLGNNVANNGGNGISVLPSVSQSGLVEAAIDANPVIITSTNHGLLTGDEIIIQGMVNDDTTVNHPGNGRHTITRIDNNRFQLDGVNGLAAGVLYVGGGAWYKAEFVGGVADGLVTVDLQTNLPQGTVRDATNAGPIVITSPNHGLTGGERIRISNAAGNTAANGIHKVSVIDADTFSLDGTTGNGAYDTSSGFASWTANVVTGATNTEGIVITSPGHGLTSGEQVRLTGIQGNAAANGTFTIDVLDTDTFRLRNSQGNGAYAGGGNWVALLADVGGDLLPQRIGDNLITGNQGTGIFADLKVGTNFLADVVSNTISQNNFKGIHIESHSFGLGTDLPLDPNNPLALPGPQDISFDVNIGTAAAGDGNVLDGNLQAGIVIEALDFATGSFEIRQNTITTSRDDNDNNTPYAGDGIIIRLDSDELPSEAVSLLAQSVIDDNTIGVDNLGNDGSGIVFTMTERTRIQDLEVTNNNFLNNGDDGFRFRRVEDADLNSVIFEKNRSTNNGGDGFDLFASNTVKDELDFRINENVIEDNAVYGLRIDVQADARISVELNANDILRNGHTPAGQGFHPNDGVSGSANSGGGIGIHAFQQVDVTITSADSNINDNIGDGLSVDAFNFFDTLKFIATFTNAEFNRNTLTGFRNHGASFGTVSWTGSEFNFNGEDGVRYASIEDKNDFFQRRVGGADLDVIGLSNQFLANGESGMMLGMGVSAVLGDGTISGANLFDSNGEDGLKVTQDVGPYLASLRRRRHILAQQNFYRGNQGDGIDIGHHAAFEAGNVEHGEEVASDVNVVIDNSVIAGNRGDGVEYLGDSVLRIAPVVGGGQDVDQDQALYEELNKSSLLVSNSRITNNSGRGVDILNRVGEDSLISLINNEILSNGLSGVYVMNTASHNQLQTGPSDPLDVYFEEIATRDDDQRVFVTSSADQGRQREVYFEISPNIELRFQDNLVESNGSSTVQSVVPINSSDLGQDASGNQSSDWYHNFGTVNGTLGGLVLRVGTVDSAGSQQVDFGSFVDIREAKTGYELGLSGIDAEVVNNSFDGNIGADFYVDSYVSQLAVQSQGNFQEGLNPSYIWSEGYRDALARLDLVFRGNVGNSLDVTNGFAFVDNEEDYFKSRNTNSSASPPNNQAFGNLNPNGFFANSGRKRNLTRTIGWLNPMGFAPDSMPMILDNGDIFEGAPLFAYDGLGTSTFRVESDFDFNNFDQTSSVLGFSDFFDTISMDLSGIDYQWDTGVNTPSFIGATPFSLARGDIFNVQAGEAPIQADSLEGNDSFLGAFDLGSLGGAGFSVNSLASGGNLNLHLKSNRDYYKFTAAGTGAASIDLGVTDALGDNISFMLYEIDDSRDTEEVPLLTNADGSPAFLVSTAGGTNTLNANVVAGRTYILEVFSSEQENITDGTDWTADGQSFFFGTSRSYTVTVNTPAPPAAPAGDGDDGDDGAEGGAVSGNPVATVLPVSPDPRSSAVTTLTVTFNEDVRNVDIEDFELTRDGASIDLLELTVTTVDPMQYTLDLSQLTAEPGVYEFRVLASSDIVDVDEGLSLQADATDSWEVRTGLNIFTDSIDTFVGDGTATDIDGNTSLRAAVMEANASVGPDIIDLAAGTYTLTLDGRYEDGSRSGDLDIIDNVTIRGVDAWSTFIDAGSIDRIFEVFPGAVLTLENLTLTGGLAHDGGAIFNRGTVNLSGVNIAYNEALNQGGGIYNMGTLTGDRGSVSLNTAGSRGGGILNRGELTLVNTTLSTNTAVSRGGGLHTDEDSAGVTISADLTNVTIANNRVLSRGGGLASDAGPSVRIGNTLIADNLAGQKNADFLRSINSQGFNLISLLDSIYTTPIEGGLDTTDLFGRFGTEIDAGLGAITRLGGDGSWFHPLVNSGGTVSPAIDAGSDGLFPQSPVIDQVDQLGSPRWVDGNMDADVRIDIGAVEYFVGIPVAKIIATPNPAGAGETISLDGSLSTHTNPVVGRILTYEWDFDWDGVPGNFTVDATGSTASTSFPSIGSYTVGLRVTDNSSPAQIAYTSEVIVVGLPAKPTITRPFPVTTDLTPNVAWNAGNGTFRLVIDNLTTGTTGVVDVSGLTDLNYTIPSNLTPGNYRAWVTASNATGSVTSDPYDFEITRIDIINPGSTTFDHTPIFEWTAVPDTSRYDLWVNRQSPTHISQILRRDSISSADTTFEPGSSLGPGTFYAWVRAYDSDGVAGDWSLAQRFDIVRAEILTPNKATLDTTPTFTWTDLGAARYDLWVNRVGGPQQIIREQAVVGTSFTPTTPLPNGSYVAWVRPIAADGEAGLWSLAQDFQMDYRVGPTLVSPTGTETDPTPTFVWDAIDGVASYDLWVDRTGAGGLPQYLRVTDVPDVDGAAQISYTSSTYFVGGDYRWWVRAQADDGTYGAWSNPVDFTVPRPVIISPIGTVTSTNTPTFEWTGVPEYVTYELWVDNQSNGVSRVIHETALQTTTYTPPLPLEDATFISWVRGVDAAGNKSQWSNPEIFTIQAGVGTAPTAVSPLGAGFSNPLTFQWRGVADAATYQIIVKSMSQFGQPTVIDQSGITATGGAGTLESWVATTNLNVGNYRWWVRGISASNNKGPWSSPLNFTVSHVDVPEQGSEDSPMAPALIPGLDEAVPAVFVAAHQAEEVEPQFHRITMHPVMLVEEVAEPVREPEASVPVEMITDEAQPVLDAVEADADATDAVMENIADALFDDAMLIPANPSEEEGGTSAAVAGLLGAAVVTGEPRRKRQSRRKAKRNG